MRINRSLIIVLLVIALLAATQFGFAMRGQRQSRGSSAHPYASAEAVSAPRLFAEGVVNTPADEYGPSFTPDGRTVYFAKRSADRRMEHIYFSRFAEGKWGEPQVAPFSGKYFDKEPFVAPGGARLFFSSQRPADPALDPSELAAWTSVARAILNLDETITRE